MQILVGLLEQFCWLWQLCSWDDWGQIDLGWPGFEQNAGGVSMIALAEHQPLVKG